MASASLLKSQPLVALNRLLRECYPKTEGESFNVTSYPNMHNRGGKFNIPENKYKEFIKYYSGCIAEQSGTICLGLTEVIGSVCPVIVDIDLSFRSEAVHYTDEVLLSFVRAYNVAIRELVQDCESKVFNCCVLEKTHNVYINEGVYKRGIHLHFPYCFIETSIQCTLLRNKVIEILNRDTEFTEYISMNVIKPLHNIIDEFPKEGKTWLMYGAKKNMEAEAYLLTKVFNDSLEPITFEECFPLMEGLDHDITFYLPQLFSIVTENIGLQLNNGNIRNEMAEIVNDNEMAEDIDEESEESNESEEDDNIDILENITPEEALYRDTKALVGMLSEDRATDYNTWLQVGIALFNIYQGSKKGLRLWDSWSSKSARYDEGGCRSKWQSFTNGGLGIGSLKMWAKEDSPEEYEDYHRSLIDSMLVRSLSSGDYIVAKAFHTIYKGQFVCTDVSKSTFYQWIGHRWKKLKEPVVIRNIISEEFSRYYTKITDSLNNKLARCRQELEEIRNNNDEDDAARINNIITNTNKLINEYKKKDEALGKLLVNLNKNAYKGALVKTIGDLFYVEDFFENLDENPALLAFENGVLDLELGEVRPGKQEDLVSLTTEYDYIPWETYNNPEYQDHYLVNQLKEYLFQVFPNKVMRKFAKRFMVSTLRGVNTDKFFMNWHGEADGGKSSLKKIMEQAFGQYSHTFNSSMITQKRGASSAASPDVMAMKAIRLAWFQEPSQNESPNPGIVKELTGMDTLAARQLFDGQIYNLIPQFKIILLLNNILKMPLDDAAFWNRLVIISFESKFNNEAPVTREEQIIQKHFPADKQFHIKVKKLAPAFMSYLIHKYKKYRYENLTVPDVVRSKVKEIQKYNDTYANFVVECIERSAKDTPEKELPKVLSTELYNHFKLWYSESYPRRDAPSKQDFLVKIMKYVGPAVGARPVFKGIKLLAWNSLE